MKYELLHIAALCNSKLIGFNDEVSSVLSDSRSLVNPEGVLFVAIKGLNHDGHNYVQKMLDRGVRAFIVERDFDISQLSDIQNASFIVAKNSIDALQRWAKDARDRFEGVVVGVTGSNGKTVVKEWISQLMPSDVKVFRSPKSYNSQLGVALSLLMIQGDEKVAIIEAGISKCGEMARLERMIRPDVGVVTTLGDAHQENFESLDQKLEEKLTLFKGAKTIIYNSDYEPIAKALELGFECEKIDVKDYLSLESNFKDRASREDLALALGVVDVLGFVGLQMQAKIADLQVVAMRMELKDGINNSVIVNDTYNSDINSLAIALDYLNVVASGRKKTLILSDILQSGLADNELYRRVAQMIAEHKVDRLIGIGKQLSRREKLFDCDKEFYLSADDFLGQLTREHTLDRVILIKGNRREHFEAVSYALQLKTHTTTLEVDLGMMVANLNDFRAKLKPEVRLMVMVKASSYGHGGPEVALTLQHEGVDYLAVAFADEGVELRRHGISMPIVVLNADSDSFETMIANDLEPEIYNFSSLESFVSLAKSYGEVSYPVHIKFDTGMGRLGFREDDLERLADLLRQNSSVVRVETMFSHFAVSDEVDQDEYTLHQLALFNKMTSKLSLELDYQPLKHIANSAAIERFPDSQLDMCRLGIGLYAGCSEGDKEQFIGALKTRIVHIKDVCRGETIGYGREGRVEKDMKIATIPVGYADGLDRHLGNGRWAVSVEGRKAPIVGRICMDTCMIDVSGMEVKEGDTVMIFGNQKGFTQNDMARVLDTISYEIMTSVASRVKRIYIKE